MQFIIIDGNMSREPDVRFDNTGKALVTLNVAVRDGKKDKDTNEFIETTNWYRVHISGPRVNYIQRAAGKGTQVFVSGRLNIGSYTSRDGELRTTYDIWATDVTLGARTLRTDNNDGEEPTEEKTTAASTPRNTTNRKSSAKAASATTADDSQLEDLPF